jgi:hypothetical protein
MSPSNNPMISSASVVSACVHIAKNTSAADRQGIPTLEQSPNGPPQVLKIVQCGVPGVITTFESDIVVVWIGAGTIWDQITRTILCMLL